MIDFQSIIIIIKTFTDWFPINYYYCYYYYYKHSMIDVQTIIIIIIKNIHWLISNQSVNVIIENIHWLISNQSVNVFNNVILPSNSAAPWWWSHDRNTSERF